MLETHNPPCCASQKSWIFDAETPLTCVATNTKYQVIAIAGRNLLQVLKIGTDDFISMHRLKNPHRLMMANQPASGVTSTKAGSVFPARGYGINDVAWSDCGDILATCSNSGDLIVWDINRGMSQTVSFCGHSRTVHRIHFNPGSPDEVITASQDGTVKLFDIRDPVQSCRRTFLHRTGSLSPVRDVVYCPRGGVLLAAAQENGIVNIWDTRQESKPYRSFQGHSCSVLSIDWHPDWNKDSRNWLATAGGRDHMIKVWDFNQPTGHQTPLVIYSVRTSNVGQVRWRIGQSTQLISSCSLTIDLSVHLWELERPFIPFVSFEGHADQVTALTWSESSDAFFSVGKDGLLIRHYYTDGVQTVRQANSVALAISSQGRLVHAIGREQLANQKAAVTANRPSGTMLRTASDISRGLVLMGGSVRKRVSLQQNAAVMSGTTGKQSLAAAAAASISQSVAVAAAQSHQSTPTANEAMISAAKFISQGASELFEGKILLDPPMDPVLLSLQDACSVSALLLPDMLVFLAENYRFTGTSVDEVCAHNATVAARCGQSFLAQFWMTLKIIFGQPTICPLDQSYAATKTFPINPKENSHKIVRPQQLERVEKIDRIRRRRYSILDSPSSRNAVHASSTSTNSGGRLVCLFDLLDGEQKSQRTVTPVTSKNQTEMGFGGKKHYHDDEGEDDILTRSSRQTTHSQLVSGSLGESVKFLFNEEVKHNEEPDSVGDHRRSGTLTNVEDNFSVFQVEDEVDANFRCHAIGVQLSSEPYRKLSTSMHSALLKEACGSRHQIDSPISESKKNDDFFLGEHGRCSADPTSINSGISEPGVRKSKSSSQCQHPSISSASLDSVCGGLDVTSSLNPLDLASSVFVPSSKSNGQSAGVRQPKTSSSNNLIPDFIPLLGPWFVELVDVGHVQSVCTALVVLGTERTGINECTTEKQIENWFYDYIDLLARFRLWSVSTRIIKQCGSVFGGVDDRECGGGIRIASTVSSASALWPIGTRVPEMRRRVSVVTLSGQTAKELSQVQRQHQQLQHKKISTEPLKLRQTALPLARHVAALNQAGTSISIRCGKCTKPMQRTYPSASTANPASINPSSTPCNQHQSPKIQPMQPQQPVSAAWACSRHSSSAETALATCAICHLTVRGLFLFCLGCSHGGHLGHMQEWLRGRRECPAGCGHHCHYGPVESVSFSILAA